MNSLRKLITAASLVALLGCTEEKSPSSKLPAPRKSPGMPNILVIFVDVTRFDSFGFANNYGNTPFLSRLASTATFFPNAVTPDTWTPASHAAFFANRTAAWKEKPVRPYFGMAMFLRSRGYDTLLMADNPYLMPVIDFMKGFDKIQLLKAQDALDDDRALAFYPTSKAAHNFGVMLERNDRRNIKPWKRLAARFRDRKPEEIRWVSLKNHFDRKAYFDWRYRSLKEHLTSREKKAPFYLFLNVQGWVPELKHPDAVEAWFRDFCAQNFDDMPPDEEVRLFGRFLLDFGLFYKDPKDGVKIPDSFGIVQARLYAEFCDLIIEDLVAFLKSAGYMGVNDILMIATDHGHSWREHGFAFYAHGEVGRTYEEIVRSPLLVQAPRFLRNGTYDVRVSLMDIYPTVVSWITDPKPYVELFNPCYSAPLAQRIHSRTAVCLDTVMGTELVYKETLKYFNSKKFRSGYLFDLASDPFEERNLSGHLERRDDIDIMTTLSKSRVKEEERIRPVVERLAIQFAEGKPNEPTPKKEDENLKALRALGYLQ